MGNKNRIKASFKLFDMLKCCSSSLSEDIGDNDAALALVDEDKMRCHILDCLTALHLVQLQRENKIGAASNENLELVKRKVFNEAISIVVDDEFDNDAIFNAILSAFPDVKKMSDERSWLPMHFAIALTAKNIITEDDVRILLSADPMVMYRLSKK